MLGKKGVKKVVVGHMTYYIYDRDDEVSLAQMLIREGKSVEEVAKLLRVTPKKVKEYLADCWS